MIKHKSSEYLRFWTEKRVNVRVSIGHWNAQVKETTMLFDSRGGDSKPLSHLSYFVQAAQGFQNIILVFKLGTLSDIKWHKSSLLSQPLYFLVIRHICWKERQRHATYNPQCTLGKPCSWCVCYTYLKSSEFYFNKLCHPKDVLESVSHTQSSVKQGRLFFHFAWADW